MKVLDEELFFIINIREEREVINFFFVGNVKVVVYIKGKDGVIIYLKNGE